MSKRCMGCMQTYGEQYEICPWCGYIEGTPPKEAYHMTPGTKLHNRYIAGQVIGYGGFGVTYAGWDTVLEKKVAIKEYLPSEFATRVPGEATITVYSGEKTVQFNIGKQKFSEEAKRLAQFNSVEGVVEIFDTFQDNKTGYIVMEFLEGQTLKERIKRDGKIPVDEALEITESILTTLEQVHKGEIIHRDIAPDNVFLCSDGRIKLLDFGASRYATVQHSKSLSVILKEGYAPEEQYRSKGEQGPWSDVYAVGATLYKMLTGVTPEDAMERAENDKLRSVKKYGVKLSREAETALMNALNVFSEDRTQSAREFKEELEADIVRRKERTRKKIDLGKWPLWSKVLVGCIAVVLAASGVILSKNSVYALEEGQTYVPEVINTKDDKAAKIAEKSDLLLKIIGQEQSEKVDQAKVMTQYPDAGRVVAVGEIIEVKISAGNIVTMVDLSGMNKDEADILLRTLGFVNIEYIEEEAAASAGTIIRQSIDAGEEASLDEAIKITVSSGLSNIDSSKDTTVPKLTGLSYEKAVEKATACKLYVVKGETKESSKPAGTVISQDIKDGSSVKEGTTITVNISAGYSSSEDNDGKQEEADNRIEVPYVEYMTEAEAKMILSAYNLKYSVSYKHSETVKSGLVMSQGTSAGKKVSPGSKIKLVVSEGRQTVSVPNVNGMNYSDAISTLQDKGFRYSITYVSSESVSWGKVMEQSLSGKQEKGTKIDLVASKGTAGRLVSKDEYDSNYSDNTKYSADKRYRYATRSRLTTYSGNSSLSGYDYEGKEILEVTEDSMPKKYDDTKGKVEDYGDYAVSTTYVSPTTVQRSKVCISPCRHQIMWKNTGGKCLDCNKNTTDILIVYTQKHIYNAGLLNDGKGDGDRIYPSGTISVGGNSKLGYIYAMYFNSAKVDSFKTKNGKNKIFLWPAESPPTRVFYKKHTEKYRYKFSYWGDWSSWGNWTTRQSTSETVKEDSSHMYYVIGKAPS